MAVKQNTLKFVVCLSIIIEDFILIRRLYHEQ